MSKDVFPLLGWDTNEGHAFARNAKEAIMSNERSVHLSNVDPSGGRSDVPATNRTPRGAWASMKRGLRGRCPACGEGRILRGYLAVNDACPACGEEFHHHRADDFPPYITIFVVGHILGALMFAVDDAWPDLPTSVHYVIWPSLCVLLSLWLLPIFKGGLIAYQWALRMHGFETAHPKPSGVACVDATPVPRQSAA